jgi:hypothetical protein
MILSEHVLPFITHIKIGLSKYGSSFATEHNDHKLYEYVQRLHEYVQRLQFTHFKAVRTLKHFL